MIRNVNSQHWGYDHIQSSLMQYLCLPFSNCVSSETSFYCKRKYSIALDDEEIIIMQNTA